MVQLDSNVYLLNVSYSLVFAGLIQCAVIDILVTITLTMATDGFFFLMSYFPDFLYFVPLVTLRVN